MKATIRDYSTMEKTLAPLGFEHQGKGFFWHGLTERLFDFSACSPEGIIPTVYLLGRVAGKNSLRDELNELLTIQK